MADGDATIKEGMFCVEEESEEDGEVLDLEGQGLTSIKITDNAKPQTLILNNNNLTRLDGVNAYADLSQLSAVNNQIVRMTDLHMLTSLTVLSLSNNSIEAIEGLEDLSQLMWLDLSSNSIKVIGNLPKGGKLHYLDLSDNDITHFSDLSALSDLKTLLVHNNNISSLKTTGCLPQGLGVLSLAGNNISDLNEICFLSRLHLLEQLSLAGNPCVLKSSEDKGFDYRPYVWNWCPSLHILDALVITDKERLLGEWLYSQGKGRKFHPGEHYQLENYLVTTCPLNSPEQLGADEGDKLSQILNQQQRYQKQLQQASHQLHPTDNFSLQETNSNCIHRTDVSCLAAQSMCVNDLILQNLSYDGDARSSLLESDSVYLPFDVPASPVHLHYSGLTSDKQPSLYSKPVVAATKGVTQKHDHHIHLSKVPDPSKHDSIEQRPIHPLNQQIGKNVQRTSLHVARPMSSVSEPSISTPKDNTLVTARSEDYDSGSEQTVSESDSIPPDLIQPCVAQASVNTRMDSNTMSAPSEKLSHIKTVAGRKKWSNQTSNHLIQRTKAATKVRSGTNLIMKSLFSNYSSSSATPEASNSVASAPVRVHAHRSSSFCAEHIAANTDIPEININKELRDIPKQDNSNHHEVHDNKLIKGQLNQERMEQKRNAVSLKVNKAAAMIQAYWRGYRTRHCNAQVVSIRKEIRARRAEDHIMLLRQDLERNRKLYDEEKQLRILQMEAIRLLFKEVQDLKSHSLASSKDLNSPDDCTSSASLKLSPATRARSAVSPVTASSSELDKTQELERMCAGLQGQVSQLQEALESVSSAVFKANIFDSAGFDISDDSDKIVVSAVPDSQFNKDCPLDEASQWGCIPHSLSPYPSEEENLYYCQVSSPGAPTPPRHLQLRHDSHHSLLLSWQAPSCCAHNWQEQEGNKHIIGYRVYMNDQLKAFICQRTCVLVAGLNPSTIYKFYVKALSGFGESFESNIIMAKLAKGQERSTFEASCETDSSQDSDKDCHSMENNDKQRYKSRKLRKSPRLAEKSKNTKVIAHHRRQKVFSELGEHTSEVVDSSNNCLLDNTFAILTHPKVHTHRRHRGKEYHSEESKHYPSETSQESSPCTGTVARTGDQKPEAALSNPQMSPVPSKINSRSSSVRDSRKLCEFSQIEHRREEDLSDTERINNLSTNVTNESIATHKKYLSSRTNESPPTGSRRQGSPSSYRRIETTEQTHASPICGTENEDRHKVSPKSGVESSPLRVFPSAGSSDRSEQLSSSFSETFTVDKAHSFLQSVPAIAQSILGDRSAGNNGIQDHKVSKSPACIYSKVSQELTQDCLSVEETSQGDIDGFSDNKESVLREKCESAGKMKGNRRNYRKDISFEIQNSNIDDIGGVWEENRSEINRTGVGSNKIDNDIVTQAEVKAGYINLLSQPIIDGRRRHSSGSRPNSPGISSGERPRLSVAELMMEQKLKTITKSVSLTTSSGRTESGSRSENSRRSPSPNSCQEEDSSHNAESVMNVVVQVSKKHQNNESGSTKTETSRRSPSSESLPESIPENTHNSSASQRKMNTGSRSSVTGGQISGCKRSWSVGSVNDLSRNEGAYSRANSLVSKLLLRLESITRNNSTSFRDRSDAFKLKKSNSDERDCETGASKPPSDDERRSGPRSRNLSDSDIEGKISDPGSQLPPRIPSDNSSGSHSDDNHHSNTRHRRTPSDHRPPDSYRPTHSPIIMEGAIRKTSSSMRRNQSFHGLLPSKHQDAKNPPSSNEEFATKTEDQNTSLPHSDSSGGPSSNMRSRTPSPRGKKFVRPAVQLKGLTESSKL